jgi:hypothetical protein
MNSVSEAFSHVLQARCAARVVVAAISSIALPQRVQQNDNEYAAPCCCSVLIIHRDVTLWVTV